MVKIYSTSSKKELTGIKNSSVIVYNDKMCNKPVARIPKRVSLVINIFDLALGVFSHCFPNLVSTAETPPLATENTFISK